LPYTNKDSYPRIKDYLNLIYNSIRNQTMSSPKTIGLPNHMQLSKPAFQKMLFIANALEQGWTIRKSQDSYIFTKKHENRQEVFQENYLETFVASNLSVDYVLNSPA